MRLSVSIPVVATLLLMACQPVVVRVGKRSQDVEAESSIPYQSEANAIQVASWNSLEDLLQNLDEIKKLGRDALLQRYHKDGRAQIRKTFRLFRDAVTSEATGKSSTKLPYLEMLSAGGCVPISTSDIFNLEVYGDLRSLLETAFLSRIKPSAAVPDPALPDGIDELTKLGFFELGIAMDGLSYFIDDGQKQTQGSDLSWKVVHEQNEPEAWFPLDQSRVQFRFQRIQDNLNRTNFILDAQVFPGLDEAERAVSLPTLRLSYEKTAEGPDQSHQTMILQSGMWDTAGQWRQLAISRRITVSQDILQGNILHVTATEHWQLPDAIEKKFRIDIDARRLCSVLGGS